MNWTDNQITIAKESSYGTAVVPTLSVPIKPSDGIVANQEIIGNEAIKTTPSKNKSFSRGKRSYEGTFELDAYPQVLGHLLMSAFGAVSTAVASGESAVYEHTFTEDADKKSFTVEQVIGTFVKRYAGFVISKVTISAVVGENLKINIEGMAKTSADATKVSASYESSKPLSFEDITSLSINSVDYKGYVSEFSFEYTNGLQKFYGMGDVEPTQKFIGQSEFKGNIKMYVDNTTKAFIEDHLAGTERDLNVLIEGASIGTAENMGLEIDADKVAITATTTNLDFEINALDLEFEAREDATNGLVRMILTNETSSY